MLQLENTCTLQAQAEHEGSTDGARSEHQAILILKVTKTVSSSMQLSPSF
jgi:hypothetical protein